MAKRAAFAVRAVYGGDEAQPQTATDIEYVSRRRLEEIRAALERCDPESAFAAEATKLCNITAAKAVYNRRDTQAARSIIQGTRGLNASQKESYDRRDVRAARPTIQGTRGTVTSRRLPRYDDTRTKAMGGLDIDPLEPGDTIGLSIVDSDGLMISLMASLYHPFGSGVVSPALGFVMQGRGANFAVGIPGHPNEYRAGARPFHTLCPTAVLRDGEPWLGIAMKGGDRQPAATTQVLSLMVDHGLSLAEAIAAPRWRHVGSAHPGHPCTHHPLKATGGVVQFDQLARLPPMTIRGLKNRGHKVVAVSKGFADSAFGVAQAVMIHDRATHDHPALLEAVTDFRRKPGAAKVGEMSSTAGRRIKKRGIHTNSDHNTMGGKEAPQRRITAVVVVLEPGANLAMFCLRMCVSSGNDDQGRMLVLTVLSMERKLYPRRRGNLSGFEETPLSRFEFSPLCKDENLGDVSESIVVEAASDDGAPPAKLLASALEWAASGGDHDVAAVIQLSATGVRVATHGRLVALVQSMDLAAHASTLSSHQTAVGAMGLSTDADGVMHNPTLVRLSPMTFPTQPNQRYNVTDSTSTGVIEDRDMAMAMTSQSYHHADQRGCMAGDVLSAPFVARGHRLAVCLRSGACRTEHGNVATRIHVSSGDALTCAVATVSEGPRRASSRGTIDNFRLRTQVVAEESAHSTGQACVLPGVVALVKRNDNVMRKVLEVFERLKDIIGLDFFISAGWVRHKPQRALYHGD
jgi:hypothetical protein